MEGLLTFQQIGNIGDKIAQARIADTQGDIEHRNLALKGAVGIIDLILKHEFRIGPVHEMTILRNVIQDIIDGTGLYDCSLESLEQYCLPFARLAQKNKL